MTTELRFLIGSVILGLVHLITSSHLISWQRGYRWTASNREEDVLPLHGLPNRVDQATTNFLETFPFFAALVLIAYAALFDSNFITEGIIAINHSLQSTRSWPTLEVRSGGKRP